LSPAAVPPARPRGLEARNTLPKIVGGADRTVLSALKHAHPFLCQASVFTAVRNAFLY
jgi:hypothetical protein